MLIEEKRNIGEEVNDSINNAYRLGYQRGLEQGRREKNPKLSEEELGKLVLAYLVDTLKDAMEREGVSNG